MPDHGPIVLASASPRRRALLEAVGLTLTVRATDVDESVRSQMAPEAHAMDLATRKARAAGPHPVVVAADTVVHRDGQIFDKPESREIARAHLTALSGRWHRVTTGVCVRRGSAEQVFSVTTEVRFRDLPPAEIEAYLATGEADDKAGAYGIQGRGGALVAEIRGSYTNVVGLPLEETLGALGWSS
jgi:septum formation protein